MLPGPRGGGVAGRNEAHPVPDSGSDEDSDASGAGWVSVPVGVSERAGRRGGRVLEVPHGIAVSPGSSVSLSPGSSDGSPSLAALVARGERRNRRAEADCSLRGLWARKCKIDTNGALVVGILLGTLAMVVLLLVFVLGDYYNFPQAHHRGSNDVVTSSSALSSIKPETRAFHFQAQAAERGDFESDFPINSGSDSGSGSAGHGPGGAKKSKVIVTSIKWAYHRYWKKDHLEVGYPYGAEDWARALGFDGVGSWISEAGETYLYGRDLGGCGCDHCGGCGCEESESGAERESGSGSGSESSHSSGSESSGSALELGHSQSHHDVSSDPNKSSCDCPCSDFCDDEEQKPPDLGAIGIPIPNPGSGAGDSDLEEAGGQREEMDALGASSVSKSGVDVLFGRSQTGKPRAKFTPNVHKRVTRDEGLGTGPLGDRRATALPAPKEREEPRFEGGDGGELLAEPQSGSQGELPALNAKRARCPGACQCSSCSRRLASRCGSAVTNHDLGLTRFLKVSFCLLILVGAGLMYTYEVPVIDLYWMLFPLLILCSVLVVVSSACWVISCFNLKQCRNPKADPAHDLTACGCCCTKHARDGLINRCCWACLLVLLLAVLLFWINYVWHNDMFDARNTGMTDGERHVITCKDAIESMFCFEMQPNGECKTCYIASDSDRWDGLEICTHWFHVFVVLSCLSLSCFLVQNIVLGFPIWDCFDAKRPGSAYRKIWSLGQHWLWCGCVPMLLIFCIRGRILVKKGQPEVTSNNSSSGWPKQCMPLGCCFEFDSFRNDCRTGDVGHSDHGCCGASAFLLRCVSCHWGRLCGFCPPACTPGEAAENGWCGEGSFCWGLCAGKETFFAPCCETSEYNRNVEAAKTLGLEPREQVPAMWEDDFYKKAVAYKGEDERREKPHWRKEHFEEWAGILEEAKREVAAKTKSKKK